MRSTPKSTPSGRSRRRSAHHHHAHANGKASHLASRSQRPHHRPPAMTSKERTAAALLDRQIDLPMYALLALLICHALSGTSSLSLQHISAHLPLRHILPPTWSRHLSSHRIPLLASYATDLPNASRDPKPSGMLGATPFRSEAAGFGHPLTALHAFTRACLGLSYGVPTAASSHQRPPRTGGVGGGGALAWMEGVAGSSQSPSLADATLDYLAHPARAGAAALADGSGAVNAASGMAGAMDLEEPWGWMFGSPAVEYAKGPKDILYVLTWVLMFTALRAFAIKYVLVPAGGLLVARHATPAGAGAAALREARRRGKEVQRFAEQAWSVAYYLVSWSLGLYIAYHSPYWLRPSAVFDGWPAIQLDGLMKFYYLFQCGFWVQQLFVLNIEARRKDHWQMFGHHIITITLLLGSYAAHFTGVGNAVLVLMDPSDILLSLAKCLRYCGLQMACDVGFGAFMLSWIVTRHVFYNLLLARCVDGANSLPDDARLPSYLQRTTATGASVRFGFVALLAALQLILLGWFVMIVRVAWRVVTGAGATDTRSDDEDEEEEEASEDDDGEANGVGDDGVAAGGTKKALGQPPSSNQPPAQVEKVAHTAGRTADEQPGARRAAPGPTTVATDAESPRRGLAVATADRGGTSGNTAQVAIKAARASGASTASNHASRRRAR